MLCTALVQNYTRTIDSHGREVVKRREADTDGLPPGRHRITSPYDRDARRGMKRDLAWNGYKLHISETRDTASTASTTSTAGGPADDIPAGPPNLITNVATTDASVPDNAMTEPIHAMLARRGLLPGEHYLDSGYPSADLLVTSLTRYGIALITPLRPDTSPQAATPDGFDRTAFTIDWDAQHVTCPQGHTTRSWNPTSQRGTDVIVVRFAGEACQPCPVKARCTTATRTGRQLTLRPKAVQQALDQARTEQTTTAWQTKYALRAGAEATIAQTIAVTDARHARYRGLAKTHLEHVYQAVAINLIRLHAWWNGHPLDRTHTGHLARLELALAA